MQLDIKSNGLDVNLNQPNLNQILYEDKSFTDIVIIVDSKIIKAHKCVLASQSIFFRTFILSDFNQKNEIEIKEFPYEVISDLIKFMYLDECELNENNILDFIHLSDIHSLEKLQKLCLQYLLENSLDVDNFMKIFSNFFNIIFLSDFFIKYILTNWIEIIKNDTFYKILVKNEKLLKTLFSMISFPYKTPVSSRDRKFIENFLKTVEDTKKKHRINEVLEDKFFFEDINNLKELFVELNLDMPSFIVKKYF